MRMAGPSQSRMLFRPEVAGLARIYTTLGEDYDERVLPAIANEVMINVPGFMPAYRAA